MAATDLRRKLMAATATLLGAASSQAAAPHTDSSWTWDTSFTQYNESERIKVLEPQVGVRRQFSEDRKLTILATVDTISGATPLGTLPPTQNTSAVTVTSSSGNNVITDVGHVPLQEMTDTRLALSGTYDKPTGDDTRVQWGGSAAKEHDFISTGASYTWFKDVNQKNTTISLGVAPEFDIVTPRDGLPYSFSEYQTPTEFERHGKVKYIIGGIFGVTHILNKRTLMQLNYSPTYENGYLNDPYKLISVYNRQGDPLQALHEKRPGSRLSHSIYWLTRYNIRAQDTFSLGFRYFYDNWNIHSNTLDFSYRWQYHEKRFFEPIVRHYHQTRASFYRIGLKQADNLPDFASSDYRLSDMAGLTFGVRMGWILKNGSELTIRGEYYTQTGENRPTDAAGAQRAFDLFPTLKATILQITYSFDAHSLFGKSR